LLNRRLNFLRKKSELGSIDTEIIDNEKEQKEISNKMEHLTDVKQQTQLKISKIRTQISELQELENTMKSCLVKYNDCIDNTNYLAGVTETDLRDLGVEFDEICEFYLQEVKTPVAKEPPRTFEDHYDNDRTPAYSYDNRFESHYETSGFEPNFEETSPSAAAAYNDDPFAALRPETAPSWPINKPQPQHDPFVSSAPPKSPAGFDKDAFGSEPFSARGGGGGAAPNLPPKKPPPPRPGPPKAGPARPPPPRSAPSPVPSASSDAFGGDNSFADFANFENASF